MTKTKIAITAAFIAAAGITVADHAMTPEPPDNPNDTMIYVMTGTEEDTPADKCVIDAINLETANAFNEGALGYSYDLTALKKNCEEETGTKIKTTASVEKVSLVF